MQGSPQCDIFEIAENRPQCESVNVEFVYGHMMDSLCRYRRNHGAARIAYIMKSKGLKPRNTSYNAIIHGLCKDGGCMRAYQLLEEGSEFGFFPMVSPVSTQECIVKGRNEPCLVRQVLEVVAGYKGLGDINQLSSTLYRNTCRVFFPQDLHSAADDAMKVLGDMMTGKFCAPDAVTLTTIMCGLLTHRRAEEA